MHWFYDITHFVFSNVQVSKPQTCRCQSHIAPALHQSANGETSPCAKCIKSYHRFWLPASHARSRSLLQMFTELMPQLYFQSGAFSSSSSSSSVPGSMQEHMRCTCQPATAKLQLHLWAISIQRGLQTLIEMLSNGLVLIVFLSGKHTATSEHISTSGGPL